MDEVWTELVETVLLVGPEGWTTILPPQCRGCPAVWRRWSRLVRNNYERLVGGRNVLRTELNVTLTCKHFAFVLVIPNKQRDTEPTDEMYVDALEN